ncbi:MAG: GumC family protein [bacterium]
MNDSSQKFDSSTDEIDLFDYLNVIIKRRRMIIRNSLIAALFMAVVSMFLPSTYTATTTLLPPDEGNQQGLRGLLSNSPISVLNLPAMQATSSEIFVEILKSRTVREGVLKRKYDYKNKHQNLLQIWDLEQSKQKALKRLQKKSRILANEQGIIEISVELKDPELAAQVANTFAAELDKVNQEKSLSKAKNSRIYIEEQLKTTEESLKKASEALAEFQSQHKAVALEEQTKVAIEKAGEIKGTIMAKEVQLEVALQTMKPDNPRVIHLRKELDELKKQYDHLQFGNSVSYEEQNDYFIPFSDVPEVGLRLASLIREVKVQETVWQLLNQQYYSAKIEEARDTPTVQILDEAVPPEKRTSPKRKILVLVATFLTFSFSVFWAFVLEYSERIKQREEEYQKVRGIIEELKNDFQEIKNTFIKLLTDIKKKVKP